MQSVAARLVALSLILVLSVAVAPRGASAQLVTDARVLSPHRSVAAAEPARSDHIGANRTQSLVRHTGIGAALGALAFLVYYYALPCDAECRATDTRQERLMVLPGFVGLGALTRALVSIIRTD